MKQLLFCYKLQAPAVIHSLRNYCAIYGFLRNYCAIYGFLRKVAIDRYFEQDNPWIAQNPYFAHNICIYIAIAI